jgi:ketosteroid isomerase-like protein
MSPCVPEVVFAGTIALAVLAPAALLGASAGEAPARKRTVEIRSYNLKPGTRAEFHRLASEVAVPMLQRWKIDVVAYGPSPQDETSYFLIRSFPSRDDRQRSEDAFYGSDEWRNGPREPVLALIESYTTIVLDLDDAAIAGLRRPEAPRPDARPSAASDPEADRRAVAALDTQYQDAVKRNDAETMARILHDSFVLVLGSGKTETREDLLREARDREVEYERQDEDAGTQTVRVWGDTAVVTARLWVKGVRHGTAFDRRLWFSDTYVRTSRGWRYAFGQASLSLPPETGTTTR